MPTGPNGARARAGVPVPTDAPGQDGPPRPPAAAAAAVPPVRAAAAAPAPAPPGARPQTGPATGAARPPTGPATGAARPPTGPATGAARPPGAPPDQPDPAVRRSASVPGIPSETSQPIPQRPNAAARRMSVSPAQLREQIRDPRNVRLGVLVLGILLVLVALPVYSWAQAESRDPVFASLDSLGVPDWANTKPQDQIDGNRWCLEECRFRERTTHSTQGPEETAKAYQDALVANGWQSWKPAKCPETKVDGSYTCWTRDELTMDLWVRAPACGNVPIGVEPEGGASQGPPVGLNPEDCKGSDVSIKVRNAIADERTGPLPDVNPGEVGETPYGLVPTAAPS
ncbi:hypothetical protein O7635_21520 [Asanoa sp. WMMD1127]|uniref:hypothetical protein n=1 Tax=Asanoa sp. WMMD1127 TaxID=3016107 RepID=UPI00241767E5|nr:hypothetical protein [Asanoa sp. WMMD1127]MDG4824439.1 hypothetical protein [Asanoa sp. WMMD1127]